MNKVMCFVLAAVLSVTMLGLPVFAAEDKGMEAAVVSAKSRLDIPAEYSEFSSDVNTNENHTMYYLRWNTPSEEFVEEKTISVTVNEKGDILSYSKRASDYWSNDIKFPSYNEDQVKEIAKTFLAKANPEWMETLPEEEVTSVQGKLSYPTTTVNFTRKINGLDFCNNQVNIAVNNRTGDVYSMNATWSYVETVPATDDAISTEAAESKFAQLSPMELSYRDSGENKAVLVYSPADSGVLVNAKTGEKQDYNEVKAAYNAGYSGGASPQAMNESAKEDSAADVRLSEQEIVNIQQVEGLLGEDVLKAYALGVTELGLNDAAYVSCTYHAQNANKDEKETTYNAVLKFIFTEGEESTDAYLTLDAKTSEILSYSNYSYQDQDASITADNAKQIADGFVKAYAPDQYPAVKLEEAQEKADKTQKANYNFTYQRYENDVVFRENFLTVEVDNQTGRVVRFYKNWDKDYTFESTENLIDAEAAMKALLEQAGLKLKYEDLNQNYDMTKADVALVYALCTDKTVEVSGISGKLVDYQGKEYTDEAKEVQPVDISGHYAAEKIEKLLDAGIITLDENSDKFRPDEVITQKELLSFVSGLKAGYPIPLAADEVYRAARQFNLVKADEYTPDAKEVRQDGTKYIVRALGHDEVAQLTGIFDSGFADRDQIAAGYEGYVAIAKGYKIVNGDENNCFNPQQALTRADAAIMIYNYLAG